jgi:hypothetical protein
MLPHFQGLYIVIQLHAGIAQVFPLPWLNSTGGQAHKQNQHPHGD